MNGADESINAEAIRWHVQSAHDDMDWDGFTRWLEADDRHRTAYDEVALTDMLIGDHADLLRTGAVAANDDAPAYHEDLGDIPPSPRRVAGWKLWSGIAMAASLAAVVALPRFVEEDSIVYQTQAASRSIALSDGSRVILAPRSSLKVGSGQQIALNGAAWFDIRHDPARQMTITAGGATISDIGTQFDIQDTAGKLRVVVAQGAVRVASDQFATLELPAGRGLTVDRQSGAATVRSIATEDAGAWRSGRLSYESESLALVAADIGRYAGIRIAVSQPLQDRRFSGTLIVGNGETALRDLSQLMDISIVGGDGAYRLVARQR